MRWLLQSSAGAQCNHINHVNTQLPYAAGCAVISFINYIIAGFVKVWWITLLLSLAILFIVLSLMKKFTPKSDVVIADD